MVRGVVEGFYGRPFTGGRRAELIRHLSALDEPAYLYAPKNDPFHRIRWREESPPELVEELRRDMELAAGTGVRFIYGISPWGFRDYEHSLLSRKAENALRLGASGIAVLFDDIPQPVDGGLAERQLRLATSALEGFDCPVYLCPTVYCGELLDRYDGGEYLRGWRQNMPGGWMSFWTGDAVVSRELYGPSLDRAADLLGCRPVIWDNLLADDYCLRRIYLADLKDRMHGDHEYFLNPPECFPVALYGLYRMLTAAGAEPEWPGELGSFHEGWEVLGWFHDTPWSVSGDAAALIEGIRSGMVRGPDKGTLALLERCRGTASRFLEELEGLAWGYELAPYVRDLSRLFGQWREILMLASPELRRERLDHLVFRRLPYEHPLAALAAELNLERTGGDA
ncbi:MAG: hypothetical protein AVO35_10670 [Candidatus Aegiribacteria sp. MLS_C]|nr:MAG: hypothetical protein AVO35_10670 [Candidatus Aegiribacteria sp. MLS_C]